MSKHAAPLSRVEAALNDPFVHDVREIGARAAAKTPLFQKRQNTIAGAANAALQILTAITVLGFDLPMWLWAVVAIALFVLEGIIHATTITPVTEGVVNQIADEAEQTAARGENILAEREALEKERAELKAEKESAGSGSTPAKVEEPPAEETPGNEGLDALRKVVSHNQNN